MKNTFPLNKFIVQSSSFKYLLFFLIAVAFGIPESYGQGCGQGEMVKLHAGETINIDGLGTEAAWSRVTPSPILSLTVGQNQPGFSAQWRGMWDANYLYILVQVTDPVIKAGNGPVAGFYQYDAVEIFTDANNAKASGTYDNGDHQYGFSYGTSAATVNPTGITEGPTNKTFGTAGINYGRVSTGTGYIMEIEIPWNVIGGGIAPNPAIGTGKLIGFDIAIDDDNNNGGTRDAQYSWHTSKVNEFADASAFASVSLVDCPPPPLTDITLHSDLTCSGTNDGVIAAQASGGLSPYLYQLSKGGSVLIPFSSNNIFTGLAAGNDYTVSVQDATPAMITSPLITISPFVNNLSVSSNVSTICASSPAKLSATGGTTYTWTANPSGATAGLTVTTGANITVNPTVTTTYTVTSPAPVNLILNGNFESGNVAFSSDYVYLGPSQLPTNFTEEVYGIVHQSDSFNINFKPTLYDHTLGTVNGNLMMVDGAIQNDPNGGTSPILPANARVWSQTLAVVPNTNYTFSYWLQEGSPVSPQAQMQTKINGTVLPAGTSPNPVTAATGWNQVTYIWNSGASTTANIALYDLSTNLSGNNFALDDLSFTADCPLTKTITITIDAAPGAPATSVTQPTCTVPTGTITVTAPTASGNTYSFDNGATFQATPTSGNLSPNTYQVIVQNVTGCRSTATSATINPVVSSSVTPTTSVTQPDCTNKTGSITITSPVAAGNTYSFDNGNSFQSSAIANNLVPNTYQVVVKNSSGCLSNVASAIVNQPPVIPSAPQLTLTQPDCITATGNITVISPTTGVTYSFDNGTTFQPAATSGNLVSNTYLVVVKDNTFGCISSPSQAVIDPQPLPPSAPTVTVIQPDCTVSTGSITVTSPSSGITFSFDNGASFQTSSTINNLDPNTYQVIVKDNAGGCQSTATPVMINSQPVIPAAPSVQTPVTYCQNAQAVALGASGLNLTWYLPGGGTTTISPTPSTLSGGSFIYNVTSSNGVCESPRSSITVLVNAVSAYAGGPQVAIDQGQSVTLQGTVSGSNITILWSPEININNTAIATPTVSPLTDQVYTMSVTSGNGCKATDQVKVIVLKDLIIPNVFSPNGDGINDTWMIKNIEQYPAADMRIFNRYGQLLFETTGNNYTNNQWDGTYNGSPVAVGAYYYIIKLADGKAPLSGSISVIR